MDFYKEHQKLAKAKMILEQAEFDLNKMKNSSGQVKEEYEKVYQIDIETVISILK